MGINVIVYMAVNDVNGKFYIGITACKLAKRRREHLCAARKKFPTTKIHRAIKKYGEEKFSFIELTICESVERAYFVEKTLIHIMKPQYNITSGGEGIHGYHHTEAEKALCAERARGNKNMLGKKHSPETREKIRQAKLKNPSRFWLGKLRSQETKEKIRAKKIGKKRGKIPENVMKIFADNMRRAAKNRQKSVICSNDNRIFESACAASKFYGLSIATVSNICSGKRNSAYGLHFVWRKIA